MLSPEDIKQIFFYCSNEDPNGYYADGVDIIEFAKKIEAYVLAQKSPSPEGEGKSSMAEEETQS